MKVIIKEDNSIHKSIIKDLLLTVKMQLNIEFEVLFIDDVKDILSYNANYEGVVNIIDILDETNKNYNGIDLAKNIRNISRTSYIIFITSFDTYLTTAVNNNVEPLAYINKKSPKIKKLMIKAFNKILFQRSHFDNNVKLQFKDENSDIIYILLQNIYMMYTSPTRQKYIVIETRDQTYHVKGKILDFENRHHNLVRCNKSTIVNKNKIAKITKVENSKSRAILFDVDKELPTCILSNIFKHNLL